MKKVLVTGASGFVGGYLLESLCNPLNGLDIICISRNLESASDLRERFGVRVETIDLNDNTAIDCLLDEFCPDSIFHLASESSVSHSWKTPVLSFKNNTNIFLNLIDGVRRMNMRCRILSIGSSEEYGLVAPEDIPLSENAPLHPISPYAVARVSQELLSQVFSEGYGIDIVMTRSFNHIGPRQRDTFVVSSFAKQIVQIKQGLLDEIKVGNIDVVRDFLDVRDVVQAYIMLMKYGISGQVYNICSGEGFSLRSILERMMEIAGVNSCYRIDKSLIRPSDNPIIIGSNDKIQSGTQWRKKYSLNNSLQDILSYWETHLKQGE